MDEARLNGVLGAFAAHFVEELEDARARLSEHVDLPLDGWGATTELEIIEGNPDHQRRTGDAAVIAALDRGEDPDLEVVVRVSFRPRWRRSEGIDG